MRNFNRFTIGFLLGLIAFASTSARAGAPNDFFSEAIGAGPLDHVTSLVAPIPDVSTGQTGSTQAVLTSPHKTVNYDDITNSFNYGGGIGEPISTGVSSASADRSTGQLHAEAGVTSLINGVSLWGFGCDCTAPGYANAIAAFGDTVTFSGLTPGSNVIHFSVNIEGSLTTIPPYQTVGGKLSGQASLQVLINQPVCFNGGILPTDHGRCQLCNSDQLAIPTRFAANDNRSNFRWVDRHRHCLRNRPHPCDLGRFGTIRISRRHCSVFL